MADIKVISATLLSGHNTVQITDSIISNETIFEIYVSDPNIICNNIVVGGTTANITFDSKPTENVSIKVLLNNASGVLKVPSADITDGETTQSAINTIVADSIADINADITDLDNNKVDTSTLNDRVPSQTVLGGVLYHGTTGNEWKKLTGANVEYDENNTVNEKIDACFQSVSSGKTLIASAITDKGQPTLATDTFQTMATNISNIVSGGDILTNCTKLTLKDNLYTIRKGYLAGYYYQPVFYADNGGQVFVFDLGSSHPTSQFFVHIRFKNDAQRMYNVRLGISDAVSDTTLSQALTDSNYWTSGYLNGKNDVLVPIYANQSKRYLQIYCTWDTQYNTKSYRDEHIEINVYMR